jgi:glucan 1,3-beta-glucosidase
MLCNGNRQEKCGGPNHLTLFQLDSLTSSTSTPSSSTPSSSSTSSPGATILGWNYLGCYTDSVQARSLLFSASVPGGSQNLTQENCQIACAQAGFTLAGMEYSGECCNTLNLTYLLILKIF